MKNTVFRSFLCKRNALTDRSFILNQLVCLAKETSENKSVVLGGYLLIIIKKCWLRETKSCLDRNCRNQILIRDLFVFFFYSRLKNGPALA